jgi:hypothetical protein
MGVERAMKRKVSRDTAEEIDWRIGRSRPYERRRKWLQPPRL